MAKKKTKVKRSKRSVKRASAMSESELREKRNAEWESHVHKVRGRNA
jgi:hypothetical protein